MEQVWSQWDYERYHEEILRINVPVLIIAGEREASIGMTREVLQEDARRILAGRKPELNPSFVEGGVEVRILEGFSHFFWFEEIDGVRGADLLVNAMDDFFGWGE